MKIGIIGAGPAGLATACHLMDAGHEVVVYEKGPIAANIARYPTYMTFFSTSDLLEIGGLPITIPEDKPTRRDYLSYLNKLVRARGIQVRTYCHVEHVDGSDGSFTINGKAYGSEPFNALHEKIVIATGAYDTPQKLGIPGEDLPKVSHYYREPHEYYGQRVLIVGGRNSAVEAALDIWRNGGEVALSYRRETFQPSVKYWIRPDIENRIKAGEIQAFMPSRVVSIEPRTATLECRGETIQIANDFVLALTGYQPDTGFLSGIGIAFQPDTQRPQIHPETYESNIPGIYIVGVIQAGNISSEIFIENSRHHGEKIARALR